METNSKDFWGMNEKTFILVMHVSQFASFIIPSAGLIIPIIMWFTNKDKSEKIDEQGKYIVNWIISLFIYMVASAILMIILIGFIGIIAGAILSVVFPIIGAMKANKGEMYKYPLSIKFIK